MSLPEDPSPTSGPQAPAPPASAAARSHSCGTYGAVSVLAALAIFFTAGLVVFVISRVSRPNDGVSHRRTPTLWVPTLFLLLSGMAVESGAQYARRARLAEVGRWLWVSLALATLFAVVQAMGMADLLHAHQLSSTTRAIIGLNGLAFSLVLIHAVHVLGGMVLLTTLSVRASVGALSLQHLPSVRSVAIYWHFLEGV